VLAPSRTMTIRSTTDCLIALVAEASQMLSLEAIASVITVES